MSSESELEALVDTVKWLVDIPSETGGEGPLSNAVASRLIAVYDEACIRRRGNTLAVGERRGRPLVLLVGHLDTVPSQGQGAARLEGGRLHGLGASDMKSGLAVMIHLLEDADVREGAFDLVGVFYEGEEGPFDGNSLEPLLTAEPWLTEADFAVVLEPSDGEVQVGCNGVVNATVTFRGEAAHSARPWLGENAITKAGRWLTYLHELAPETYIVGGLEFREVMSVTRAQGGIANNIIPPLFTLNLNYRFNPSRSLAEAEETLREVCATADGIEITDRAPAGVVDSDHAFVEALREATQAPVTAKQGWTDVARLAAYKIPAVNFGPGETSLAHRVNESVRITDLTFVMEALRRVLVNGVAGGRDGV